MKKIAILMAGVAAVTLSASAAAAQSVRFVQQGEQTRVTAFELDLPAPLGNVDVAMPWLINATVDVPYNTIGNSFDISNSQNLNTANNANATNPAWHGTAFSVGNVGDALGSDSATFSLAGNVTEDCAFYTGTNNNLAFDFGQIGVYVSDNTGPAAAFTMVAPAVMTFDTNLAGCNTPNEITITKDSISGMVNNNGGGYDSTVFQNTLPYEISAQYSAVNGTGVGTGGQRTLKVLKDDADGENKAQHGAWKSDMSIVVTVPQADKALLAGNYAGKFTVTIAAN